MVTGVIQDAVVEVSSEVRAADSSSGAFAFASTASGSGSASRSLSSEASLFRAAAKNGRFHKSRAKPISGRDRRNLKSDGWNLI